MSEPSYLMESDEEAVRLDVKTDPAAVTRQAAWAGLLPGMRVADLGCGSGKTTALLHAQAQPDGSAVGIDLSAKRIEYARAHHAAAGPEFVIGDIRRPLTEFGPLDFVWIRFVLEYYHRGALDIVANAAAALRPGGILCLIDLDHNALSHHEIPARMERTLAALAAALQQRMNFDPYAGRRLYAHLYDLGFEQIRVAVEGHHVIFGKLGESDAFNWMKKIEVAPARVGYDFAEYPGGYEEFRDEFARYFADPRRFTYSPLIVAAGKKPLAAA